MKQITDTPRYCYHNKHYIAWGAAHGIFCDPARRPDGKCIVSAGKQLVKFEEDGAECIVIRRSLRLRAKCKIHKDVLASLQGEDLSAEDLHEAALLLQSLCFDLRALVARLRPWR